MKKVLEALVQMQVKMPIQTVVMVLLVAFMVSLIIYLTYKNTYTGVIPLSDIKNGKTNKIKVKINWENDENNNKMDTTIGTLKSYTINIPINVTATQYLGEEIKEYVP